jgi:hypothetical protein
VGRAGGAGPADPAAGEFGVALGVAAMGSLATVVYRTHLAEILPAGVPTQTASLARESLTAAVTAAQELPGALGAELVDAARAAFTTGLHTVAGLGAAVFAGLAVLTVAVLGSLPPSGQARPGQPEEAGTLPATVPTTGNDPGDGTVPIPVRSPTPSTSADPQASTLRRGAAMAVTGVVVVSVPVATRSGPRRSMWTSWALSSRGRTTRSPGSVGFRSRPRVAPPS